MTKSEWEALIEAWDGKSVDTEAAGLLRALSGETASASATASRAQSDVERIIVQPTRETRLERVIVQPGAESLAEYPQRTTPVPVQTASAGSSSKSDGGSLAGDVIKTIGMVTGVGPVVTGLLKLFGGDGKSDQPEYAPIPFSLPEQMSVEAGLASDRSFVGIGYGANGGPRALNASRPGVPASTQPIQINVQAMDSRSFVDHSDEIARAVREALLQSHSLNDVIADM